MMCTFVYISIKYMMILLLIAVSVNARIFVSLTFDDGLIDHYKVSKLLESYNMRGTFYVNSGRLNIKGRMSTPQLNDMYNMGHEITGHTINHLDLSTLSDDNRVLEICNDRANIEQIVPGTLVESFAFPFSKTFNGSSSVLQNCGYISGRISGGIETTFDCFGCPKVLILPPQEPFLLRSITYRLDYGNVYMTSPMEVALKTYDVENAYYWLIFVYHEVNNNSTVYTATLETEFINMLEWIRAHPTLAVVRVDEIMNSKTNDDFSELYRNAVSIPTTQSNEITTPQSTTPQPTTPQPTTPQASGSQTTPQTSQTTTRPISQTTSQTSQTTTRSTTRPTSQTTSPQTSTSSILSITQTPDNSEIGKWVGIAFGSIAAGVVLIGSLCGFIIYKKNRNKNSSSTVMGSTYPFPDYNYNYDIELSDNDIESQFDKVFVNVHDLNIENEFKNNTFVVPNLNHNCNNNSSVKMKEVERHQPNNRIVNSSVVINSHIDNELLHENVKNVGVGNGVNGVNNDVINNNGVNGVSNDVINNNGVSNGDNDIRIDFELEDIVL